MGRRVAHPLRCCIYMYILTYLLILGIGYRLTGQRLVENIEDCLR